MTFDLRSRRVARPGFIVGRAARRSMRSSPSRIFPQAAYRCGLSAAVGMDSLSSGGRTTPLPSYLRRTRDRLPAQSGRLGYPRHRSHLPRGALDHLSQADRAGVCLGRRSIHSPVAVGALGVPGRRREPDHRRYAGIPHGEERVGHQYQPRPRSQGQSTDLYKQPALGDLGLGCVSSAWVGPDGANTFLAGRGIRPVRQALGGPAVDRFGQGPRQGRALAARTAGADHWTGAARYGFVSGTRIGAQASRPRTEVRTAVRCGPARHHANALFVRNSLLETVVAGK